MTATAFLANFASALFLGLALYLSVKTPILHDQSVQQRPPYSYSRTQAMWWTVIVLSLYIVVYGHAGQVPQFNSTCAVLLGISLGTTAGARMIDAGDVANPTVVRSQDTSVSAGFLIDILSDENGLSIHRLQSFAFNLIFGVVFIVSTLEHLGE